MAPIAKFIDDGSEINLAGRATSDACLGWNCLSDAAQTGIVLVVIFLVGALGYIYWKLKIKPTLRQDGSTTNGFWAVTRRDPNRVSITIYREPRALPDEEAGTPETPVTTRDRVDHGSIPLKGILANHAHLQTCHTCTADVHLVPPPPPPPVDWTASASSVIPLPPPPVPSGGPSVFWSPGPAPAPSGPSAFWPSGPVPVPAPGYPGYPGPGAATAPLSSDVPPPYFQHPATHFAQAHENSARPPNTHQAARQPTFSRDDLNRHPETEHSSRWRRWLGLEPRAPTPGDARTLSETSSVFSRPHSPRPPFLASTCTHPSSSSSWEPAPQPRYDPRHDSRTTQHSQRPAEGWSQSECDFSSDYVNPSTSTVQHSPERRRRTYAQTSSEERSRSERGSGRGSRERRRRVRLAPSRPIPLSPLVPRDDYQNPPRRQPSRDRRREWSRDGRREPSRDRRRELSRERRRELSRDRRRDLSRERRRQPSPDIAYPGYERRRARVSFSLPPDADAEEEQGGMRRWVSGMGSRLRRAVRGDY